jgi:hypothetical protein
MVNWARRHKLVLLTIAAFLLLSAASPFIQQICQPETTPNQKYCATYQMALFFLIGSGQFLDAHNGVITGIATALLAYITWGLVLIAKEQSATTRAQLRAYVSITQVKITKQRQSIDIEFINTGQTPAYDPTISVDKIVGDCPLNVELTPRDKRRMGALGAGLRSHCTLSGFSLTVDQESRMSKGELSLYVFGRIDYKDAFGHEHWTTFRHIGGGDTPVGPQGELSLHPEGNEAD